MGSSCRQTVLSCRPSVRPSLSDEMLTDGTRRRRLQRLHGERWAASLPGCRLAHLHLHSIVFLPLLHAVNLMAFFHWCVCEPIRSYSAADNVEFPSLWRSPWIAINAPSGVIELHRSRSVRTYVPMYNTTNCRSLLYSRAWLTHDTHMARRVSEESHSFVHHSLVYPRIEWTVPAFSA